MSTTATPVVNAPLTLEEKILLAVAQSEQIVAAFSPQAAGLITAGVEVEPIISGLIHMIAGLFRHHLSTPAPAPAPVAAVPAATA